MEMFNNTTGEQPYRPLTLLSFSLEKELYYNDPSGSRLINILLYILILQTGFSILFRLFPGIHPFISAFIILLFACQPVHTQVVSSVKSRNELLVVLFGFASWKYFLPGSAGSLPARRALMLSSFCFLLSILSKEIAVAQPLRCVCKQEPTGQRFD